MAPVIINKWRCLHDNELSIFYNKKHRENDGLRPWRIENQISFNLLSSATKTFIKLKNKLRLVLKLFKLLSIKNQIFLVADL